MAVIFKSTIKQMTQLTSNWEPFTEDKARNLVDVRTVEDVHYYGCLYARGVFTELRTGDKVHQSQIAAIRESFHCR